MVEARHLAALDPAGLGGERGGERRALKLGHHRIPLRPGDEEPPRSEVPPDGRPRGPRLRPLSGNPRGSAPVGAVAGAVPVGALAGVAPVGALPRAVSVGPLEGAAPVVPLTRAASLAPRAGAAPSPHSHSPVTGGSPRCLRASLTGCACNHISSSAPSLLSAGTATPPRIPCAMSRPRKRAGSEVVRPSRGNCEAAAVD